MSSWKTQEKDFQVIVISIAFYNQISFVSYQMDGVAEYLLLLLYAAIQ